MSDNSAVREISNGNRLPRPLLVVALVLIVPALVLSELPLAYDVRNKLRDAYSPQHIELYSFRSTEADACGYYQVEADATRWKYVQTGGRMWAEGKTLEWRNLGGGSKVAQLWIDCMTRPHGKGAAVNWIGEAMIVLILRAI